MFLYLLTNLQTMTELEKAMLAKIFGVDFTTIERWEKKEDDRLTSDRAKEALKKIREFENNLYETSE